MRKDLSIEAEGCLTRNRRRRAWRKVVGVLACIVVFCTTYALILPAITMEKKGCGKTEHTHGKTCYQSGAIICGQEEHTHTAECSTQPEPTEARPEHVSKVSVLASEIGEKLDGDYAYISELKIITEKDQNGNPRTGTGSVPFDDNDNPGNDSSADNDIVRSFDILYYTLLVQNAVRDKSPYKFYKEGTLHFEFVLPASRDQAMFDVDKIAWLKSKPEAQYTITEGTYGGKPAQFLRGSFLWKPSEGNATAIGESFIELDVHLRVLAMTQDEKLQPEFTFWLEGNNVPEASPDHPDTYVPVTGSNTICPTHNDKDYNTVSASPVTVSSEPRYNILINDGRKQMLGTFNFNTGNDQALNQGAGQVYGRRVNYGLAVQIYGKSKDHGLRGCEIPNGDDITFDLDISSQYVYSNATGEYTVDSFAVGYTPLVYSVGDSNNRDVKADGRTIGGGYPYANRVPANKRNDGAQNYQSCYDGGTWKASLSEDKKTLSITISNYAVDLNFLPYGWIGESSSEYHYFNPNTISGFWDVQEATFSAGELWIVQPFRDASGELINKKFASGSFTMTVKNRNLKMSGTTPLPEDTDNGNQMNIEDDQFAWGVALEKPGTLDYDIAFQKKNNKAWNDALTDGCWGDGKDWVVAGGEMAIFDWIVHEGEGLYTGVAYDQLIKFDPDYFTPDECKSLYWHSGMFVRVGYGAVAASPDSGWDHKGKQPHEEGYDTAMINATADDMIFFESLSELQGKGYRCAGILFEYRGPSNTNNFHSDRRVTGYATSNQNLAGNVFMVTHSASVWTKSDVEQLVARQYNKSAAELTDNDYLKYMQEKFPSRFFGNTGKQVSYSTYPAYPNNYSNQGVNGTDTDRNERFKDYKKSVYNETGWVSGTSGTDYGDSCLLVPYTMEIDKSVTQTTSSGEKKTVYSIDDGQCYADYQLVGAANVGTLNLGQGSASLIKTTVYIKDTLPKGLTYVNGSSRYGGTYHQTEEGRPGSVVGGTEITPEITHNDDGTTTLLYTLENVTLDMNQKTILPSIYYTCWIGNAVDIQDNVKDKEYLTNTVQIWSTEDRQRPFNTSNRNETTATIQVSKLNMGNLLKLADQVSVDQGGEMGFTMAIGNSGANARNVIALDMLPYHGYKETNFAKGTACLSQVTELTLIKNTDGVDLTQFKVYRSPGNKPAVRDNTSTKYSYTNVSHETLVGGPGVGWGWTELPIDPATGKITLPDDCKPEAILIRGQLDAGQTLGIHMTIRLTNDTPGDKVVNHLYESGGSEAAGELHAQATTYVVGRTLEGLTWLDESRDGIQNEGPEKLLDGVKVTLLKFKGGDSAVEANYEPYCYPGTNTPIVIQTGQQISVLAQSSDAATEYEPGRYKFTDLPPGIYAVKFESGTDTDISQLLAAPANRGDDTLDSDGYAVYSDNMTLEKTVILGIELPSAEDMQTILYESKYHDSGFYSRGYELPKTGGAGTTPYTLGGALLLTGAVLLLLYKARKRGKEDFASS